MRAGLQLFILGERVFVSLENTGDLVRRPK